MSGAERREQLLDVTAALARELGFHAVSIEAVARRAGISRPIVYEHFTDLPGLLEALTARESQRALAQLADILPTDLSVDDPREALIAALRGYLEAVRAEPARWRLVLMPPEGAPATMRESIAAGRAQVIAALAAVTGSGLDSPDPELTGHLLSTVSDEAARLLLKDPDTYTVDRLIAHSDWVLGAGWRGLG